MDSQRGHGMVPSGLGSLGRCLGLVVVVMITGFLGAVDEGGEWGGAWSSSWPPPVAAAAACLLASS